MPGWRLDPTGGFIRLPPPPEEPVNGATTGVSMVQLPSWAQSPLASPEEKAVIKAARKELASVVDPAPEYLDVQLLRHLRAIGSDTADAAYMAERLADKYRASWAWKQENLKHVTPESLLPREGRWPSQADLTHGEWFTQHAIAGLRCGVSHGGHQVKIERGGLHNFDAISKHADGMRRACEHYFHLLESIEYSLDAESMACGRLLRDYEVFDFKGLSFKNCNVTTLRITARLAAAFTQNYPETIAKTAVINLPSCAAARRPSQHTHGGCATRRSPFCTVWSEQWAADAPDARAYACPGRRWAVPPMNMLLGAMPARVSERVTLLGDGQHDALLADVDAVAARLLYADRHTLTRHRGDAML